MYWFASSVTTGPSIVLSVGCVIRVGCHSNDPPMMPHLSSSSTFLQVEEEGGPPLTKNPRQLSNCSTVVSPTPSPETIFLKDTCIYRVSLKHWPKFSYRQISSYLDHWFHMKPSNKTRISEKKGCGKKHKWLWVCLWTQRWEQNVQSERLLDSVGTREACVFWREPGRSLRLQSHKWKLSQKSVYGHIQTY